MPLRDPKQQASSELLHDNLLSCAPPVWLLEQRQKLAPVQLRGRRTKNGTAQNPQNIEVYGYHPGLGPGVVFELMRNGILGHCPPPGTLWRGRGTA